MFTLINQLHKKGSSTTNVQSYTPTAQEVRLQEQAADYSEAVAPNALWLNDTARGLLQNSIGDTQVDFNSLNQTAQSQIANAQSGVSSLINGELPSAYQENMENSIKSGVNNSMGTLLTDVGNRGILNSSVTSKGISDINDAASEAMSNAYTSNIGLLSQLYGQQTSSATSGITAGAAAQEAAQQPALNLWNASLGLNSGGTLGALNAVSGQGTTTATTNTSGGSGLFGGVLSGLAGNSSLFCFAEETNVQTPSGDKEIKRIKAGDKVICPCVDQDGTVTTKEETVEKTMQPRYSDVYIVIAKDTTNKKHYVNTTLTQPLMTEDGKFITVNKITLGHKLKMAGGNTADVMSVVYSGERKVYDLKVTGENNYYADGFIAKGGTNEW